MTTKELNNKIRKLYNEVSKLQSEQSNLDVFFSIIDTEIKPKYTTLYYADDSFKSLTKESILILIKLNLRYRFIPFHQFGLNINF